ncbi:hypothetical protein [Candidatus Anaplasma sp. TIGMIC]
MDHEMMNDREVEFINSYHSTVCKTVISMLRRRLEICC